MTADKTHLTAFIKDAAQAAGFDFVGIAKAEFLETEAPRLENFLKNNFHGEMKYMENHFDKRLDPRLLVDGAKSVITLLKNYYTTPQQPDDSYKIARYAYGEDYHTVVKDDLFLILEKIKNEVGDVNARCFVDSAPVLERAWAAKSGLGWVGKNGMLINPKAGSFYFIAVIILDVELNYDHPIAQDYCGTCRRCVDACPTDAILGDKTIDGSRCISYFTIELKNEMPPDTPKWDDWMFGCDICQEVCPWNRFATQHTEEKFKPLSPISSFSKTDWQQMNEIDFTSLFKNSPINRTKWKGLQRNMGHLMKK